MAKIGVAGCGRMGKGMLANLQNAGFETNGFDIRPITGVGIDIETFADELATLITVVRDQAQTDALLFDDQALISRAPSLKTIIICSTLSPVYLLSLRERVPPQIQMIDAPMSGAQAGADAGTLTFMVGGDSGEAIAPLLQAMGCEVFYLGAFGAGMTAKVLNNLLAAVNVATTRLVLDWADALDVDEKQLLSVIHASSGQNWFASGFDTIEFARDGYASDNSIGILQKDVSAACDIAPDRGDRSLPEITQTMLHALAPRRRS